MCFVSLTSYYKYSTFSMANSVTKDGPERGNNSVIGLPKTGKYLFHSHHRLNDNYNPKNQG